MIKYKWDNWRLVSTYTDKQLKRLKQLQMLYAEMIKQNTNATEALVHTFLETDEKGVPIRGVTVEAMNPFERYTDSHPLVSYANMLQTKILKYMLERLNNAATYSNDPQSLLCLQMLHDFRECFVKAAITDALLVLVENWKKFVTRLKVATLTGENEALLPHHEEMKLRYTSQWLLSNVSGLLEQVSEEIQLELSRRSIADYLDNLAHSTKVTIELGYEYVAHMLTYIPLPLDFNLANFYDKNIDIKMHEEFYAKTWFQCLYQFASSNVIKELFFGTKVVHYELQNLMSVNTSSKQSLITHKTDVNSSKTESVVSSDNPLAIIKRSLFLTEVGEVNEGIFKQLYRQPKSTDMAKETGVLEFFCHPNQKIYLQTALKFLGYLEIIARLTRLTRVASYLLHQDGSLLARKETKSQIQLFIDIYQTLLSQLFGAIDTLNKTFDIQLDDKHRFEKQAYHCNPNLELCNVLKDKLHSLQQDCKKTLSQIHHQLLHIDQHRRELNELLCWFKQQWFGFMGNYSWLLTQGQQQTVTQLQLGEMELAKKNTPLALLAATQTKRPVLTMDIDNSVDAKVLCSLLQSQATSYPRCGGIQLADVMAFAEQNFMQRSLSQLTKGQCCFCIVTTDKGLALFAVMKNQQGKLEAIYVDTRGNTDLGALIRNYCRQGNISVTTLLEPYQANQDDAIHLYENVLILLKAQEAQFNADYLWQQITQQGLNYPAIATLKRYLFTQVLINWQTTQMNKIYDDIIVTEQLQNTTTKLEIINHASIKRDNLEQLMISFPNLILQLGEGCTQLSANDMVMFAQAYKDKFILQCFSSIENKLIEIPLGRRFDQPIILIDRCIRKGIADEKLWDSLMLAMKAKEKAEDKESALNTRLRENDNTLLHLAVSQKQPEICDYLLKQGIDKTAINEQKHTALDLAVQQLQNDSNAPTMKQVIKTLLKHNVPATLENLQKAKEYASQAEIKISPMNVFKK